MQVLISAACRYNTFMLAALAMAMSVLMIAACDSTIAPDTGATTESGDEIVLGKGHQVAVCHVGHKLPEYDPACTEDCGDAGKIDLIFVPQKVVGKHVGNPVHTYDGVSDYLPGPAGASGEGDEDTSDDGVYVDDGCVIPDQETIFAIAYTDVDPNDGDGYKEGVDVLIAKLVDANGSGAVDAGDAVVTDQYPTTFVDPAANLGNFTVTSHGVGLGLPFSNGVLVLGATFSTTFEWFKSDGFERYTEEANAPGTSIGDSSDGVTADFIEVRQGSPSGPQTQVTSISGPSASDDQFIDVDLNLP